VADGNNPAISVHVLLRARHSSRSDPIAEREGRSLPTPVVAAGRVFAELLTFGSIDAEERMRSPRISIVSPSITVARPVRLEPGPAAAVSERDSLDVGTQGKAKS
jgi:hypothetical protein